MSDSCDRRKIVSVIGTSAASPGIYALAREVGRLLAMKGCIVACGGMGGVMEAVCRGAAEKGGLSLGFLPGGMEEANPYVSIPVPTGLGEARNCLVVSAGNVVIAIGGAFGTLSELGFALKLGKTVIGLESWRARDDEGHEFPSMTASSAKEAVEMALSAMDGGCSLVEG